MFSFAVNSSADAVANSAKKPTADVARTFAEQIATNGARDTADATGKTQEVDLYDGRCDARRTCVHATAHIRALATHTRLAATHVTTEVGRLVARGLLTKSVNRHDRRGVLVRLAPRGRAAVRRVTPFLRRVNDRLFDGISRKEFAALARFFTVFSRNGEDALVEILRTERAAHARPTTRANRPRRAATLRRE
ncbi:MAG: winged helix-turn-helix transcriptional regulator [Proteobacteria bacterium]|nr:winged helix-turn-helix transcriptional regulator [Pseudomonadota bacterium]